MIKDQIKIYKNYDIFHSFCPSCFNKNHLISECPLINYIPNRNFIIDKLNYSNIQQRTPNKKISLRGKYNALTHLLVIQAKTLDQKFKLTTNEKSNSDLSVNSEEEDETSIQEKVPDREKEVMEIPLRNPKISIMKSEHSPIMILKKMKHFEKNEEHYPLTQNDISQV